MGRETTGVKENEREPSQNPLADAKSSKAEVIVMSQPIVLIQHFCGVTNAAVLISHVHPR